MEPIRLRVADPDVDDAAHLPAEAGREVPGVKVDLVEQARLHEAGQTAEVIEAIDGRALELHRRIRGRRAADDDHVGLRRASHAGHVLDGLQRIAARARHAEQLVPCEAALGDLAGRRFDRGGRAELQRGGLLRGPAGLQSVSHRGELAGGDVFVGRQGRALRGRELDVKPSRRERLEAKRPRRVAVKARAMQRAARRREVMAGSLVSKAEGEPALCSRHARPRDRRVTGSAVAEARSSADTVGHCPLGSPAGAGVVLRRRIGYGGVRVETRRALRRHGRCWRGLC